MTREAAVSHATDHVDSGRLQSELAHLVGYRSESQNPDRRDVLQDYLAQAILPRLTAAGFDCAIHDNPDGPAKGGPILLGTRIEDPSLPTILTYGHGDVIWGQAGQWLDDLDPFALTERGDRLYGRGAADNKVQHLVNIAALESVLAVRGKLGFNVKIVIEMS